MNTSRIKFIFFFLIFAFAFLYATILFLDQPPESLMGWESQAAWKSAVSIMLSPIQIILMRTLLPFNKTFRSKAYSFIREYSLDFIISLLLAMFFMFFISFGGFA